MQNRQMTRERERGRAPRQRDTVREQASFTTCAAERVTIAESQREQDSERECRQVSFFQATLTAHRPKTTTAVTTTSELKNWKNSVNVNAFQTLTQCRHEFAIVVVVAFAAVDVVVIVAAVIIVVAVIAITCSHNIPTTEEQQQQEQL